MIEGGGCGACAAGSFKDVNGSAACTLCLAGTYGTASAATSASTCNDCPRTSFHATFYVQCSALRLSTGPFRVFLVKFSLIAVFVDDVPEDATDRGIANITSLLQEFFSVNGDKVQVHREGDRQRFSKVSSSPRTTSRWNMLEH